VLIGVALVASAACRRDEGQPFRPAQPATEAPAPVPPPAPKPQGPSTTSSMPVTKVAASASSAPPTTSASAATSAASGAPSASAAALPTATPSAALSQAASGCGKPVSGAVRGVTHTTTTGRTFHVWAPPGYDGKTKLPVVLMFHGWYANGTAFQSWFKMEDHVDGKALVVYPDSQGPTWALSGDKDTSFVAKALADLEGAYCIDRAKVLAFGFSYGGKFTHTLGCTHPELVKAIAVGDGSLGGGLVKCGNLPVLVTHRTRDDDERFDWGKAAAEAWANVNGCSKDTAPSPLEHGCAAYKACKPGAPVTFCEDTYFNATWPHDWNHTVREEYRALTYRWFASLP